MVEVRSIQFGISGDDDLRAISIGKIDKTTFNIEHGSVYSPRLGCVQNDSECETCTGDVWTCPGHFGHLDLVVPVILYHKQVVVLLRCFCLTCTRIVASEQELRLHSVYGCFDKAVAFIANLSTCRHCDAPIPDIRFSVADAVITATHKHKQKKISKELTPSDIKAVFDLVTDDDVRCLGLDLIMTHPRNFVRTTFPVTPTCCRPKMMAGDNVSDDDLSIMLVDIIKNNAYLLSHPITSTTTEEDLQLYARAIQNIKLRVLAICDNSRCRVTHNTNHKPMTGIKERINRKTGLVRQNLAGKRCDRTARTVIGPDPTLKIDELAVPEEIANTITIPEYVNPFNINRLTTLINKGRVASIIRCGSNKKINVAVARIKRGTKLEHGDIVYRNGAPIPVMNCQMKLKHGDIIHKLDGKQITAVPDDIRHIELYVGDKVERYLQDGDPVFLNRQPTLHRNGMLGMRVVVKPGKTLRFNLSITKGLNADFDGDEGNMFTCEHIESHAELRHVVNVKDMMLSAQINKPEQVLVQDSLLAAYLMTYKRVPITPADFMQCLTRLTVPFDASTAFTNKIAADLFGYIMPNDFHFKGQYITIEFGKIVHGYFDKSTLGSNKNSIIRILCMEYGSEVAANFIDNIQFLTTAWLELNPFSIGIADCLMLDDDKKREIASTNARFFVEAAAVSKSTSNPTVREMRVNIALNKAKDIGLRIAKDALKPDNNCVATVMSGSKGDFFNIAQITGLLGQQNISNQRPKPTLNNRRRTLIHYPHVITSQEQHYESRGFISSCFLDGLNPKCMWFHAMTGREGMINTANKTASSGYIQRSCVKLNEDLKIEYDGTVRDACGNIHQFVYGNHGFNASSVSFDSNGPTPIDIQRLACRLKGRSDAKPLDLSEINDIVDACKWNREIPLCIYDSVAKPREQHLRSQLELVKVCADRYVEFKKRIVDAYHTSRAVPGDCVGIVSAQSIGEVQTQSNLNTFHTAGKLQSSGVDHFEEILNVSKSVKCPSMRIYFNRTFESISELRNTVGCSIVGMTLGQIVRPITSVAEYTIETGFEIHISFSLKRSILHAIRLSPDIICEAIESAFCDCECEITSPFELTVKILSPVQIIKNQLVSALKRVHVCGIDGISAMYVEKDDTTNEFLIVTDGSNLKRVLCHDLVDVKRVSTNNIIETFDCLGIAATRRMLLNNIKSVVSGVNSCHIELLVDKMTFKGRPSSITRYTMKTNAVGPLSKATFEQSVDILLDAAFKGERDPINGVSAAIITGNRVRIGTGMPELLIDFERINKDHTVSYYD